MKVLIPLDQVLTPRQVADNWAIIAKFKAAIFSTDSNDEGTPCLVAEETAVTPLRG